jgi:hypothetical protein
MNFKDSRWQIITLTLALALMVIIVVQIARAAGTTVTVTWVHPVVNTDGSALAMAEIKETVITWRRPGAPNVVVGSVRVTSPTNTATVTGLGCGNFNFTGMTVALSGAQSDESKAVPYSTGIACPPNPPSGFTAT